MENPRTIKQNKSLHLFCRELARELNEHGITQAIFLRGLEIDNSDESVKEVFRKIAEAKYLEHKTSKLSTKELIDVWEEINRHIASFGIHIPWPSKEQLL